MNDPLTAVRTRNVPQSEKTDERQVLNNAGGYTFTVDWQQRLLRFLILGTTGGTFYASQGDHTAQAADAVRTIIKDHGLEAVKIIVDISLNGRAPKQQPTLFALALASASSDADVRRAAFNAVSLVCRTGTHLFTFVKYMEQFRGWGRGARTAIAHWYLGKHLDHLAFQMVKYGSREGWSHRDLLRSSHPVPVDPEQGALFRWGVTADVTGDHARFLPGIVTGAAEIQTVTSAKVAADLIAQYSLPWEAVPSEFLNEKVVWEALLPGLGVGAALRQLPRLTRIGLLSTAADRAPLLAKITDPEVLKKARVHPLAVLNALYGYRSGEARSGGSFAPVSQVVDALDDAFYASFGAVTPINRPVMLALDVSGSMSCGWIAGTSLTPRDASAAMALVTAATEPDYEIMAFSSGFVPLSISPRQRLDDVVRTVNYLPFDRTDCSVPMAHALGAKKDIDLFAIYTDNETWSGRSHPHVALQNYRDRMSRPNASLVVVGMTATEFTIADPSDPRMLDVVGFDTATPELISAFGRGEV